MLKSLGLIGALALAVPAVAAAQSAQPNDAQIAHIAYTAGQIDIAASKQALAKSKDKAVREFAETMVRDHAAVNDQALALVKKMRKMAFGPTPKGLKAGDVIEWVNADIFRHTATARDKSFNVDLAPKKRARTVLKKAGVVAFYCKFHPGMTGTLQIAR